MVISRKNMGDYFRMPDVEDGEKFDLKWPSSPCEPSLGEIGRRSPETWRMSEVAPADSLHTRLQSMKRAKKIYDERTNVFSPSFINIGSMLSIGKDRQSSRFVVVFPFLCLHLLMCI